MVISDNSLKIAPFFFELNVFMRIVLGLEYDGSSFCGWQIQPSGGSVQDALEAALFKIAQQKISVVCAGRTDSGVHALLQIVHFDTHVNRPLEAWVRGVNSFLPSSISVLFAQIVADDFHARFSAFGRTYRYYLLNRPQKLGLWHDKAAWFHRPLNEEKMNEAAQLLIGEHDFAAFRAAQCQARSPIKTMYRAQVSRQNDCILFEFSASAFLQHMVRNLVGSLVYVGLEKHPPEWITELLAGKNRANAAPTFAPQGLYLAGVSYEDKWNLPRIKPPFLPF